MNKKELVATVAERAGLAEREAGRVVDALGEVVTECLAAGEKIALPGLGTFSTRDRAARTARNPRDPSATIDIPARTVPRFVPGSRLKAAVDGG